MEAEEFSVQMKKLTQAGANIVGGCCGTTPEHISHLVNTVKDMNPGKIASSHIRALTTENHMVEIPLDGSFMIVGERINPTGKKALQAELREDKYTIVNQMAEEQAELGASVLDINVGMNGINEKEVMKKVSTQ
jgi:5-methyltetrahydrofolate--homocysteine methyltransferase